MSTSLFDLSQEELRQVNTDLESQILSLTTTLDELESPELEASRLHYNELMKRLSSLNKEVDLLNSLTTVPEDENELLGMDNLPILANAVEAKYHLLMKRIDGQIEELKKPNDALFAKFVESGLIRMSREMAMNEGTGCERVDGGLAVTAKTASFLAELEQAKGVVSKGILPKVISEYLLTFKQGLYKELTASPQLAALFHNDCMLFVSKASEFNCHDTHVTAWRNLGIQVLESQLAFQKQEMGDALEECEEVWAGASLDFDRLATAVHRVSERLSALEELWSPVLGSTATLIARLYAVLVDWYWHHLVSLPDIGIHECDPLHTLSQSITTLALELGVFEGVQPNYHKLTASTPLLKMSLMQVGNAYRRGKIVPPLGVDELEHLVGALFAESGAREAFLNELVEDR